MINECLACGAKTETMEVDKLAIFTNDGFSFLCQVCGHVTRIYKNDNSKDKK